MRRNGSILRVWTPVSDFDLVYRQRPAFWFNLKALSWAPIDLCFLEPHESDTRGGCHDRG